MRQLEVSVGFAKFAEFTRDINYLSLQSFETEIKAKLLIQKYVRENGLSPYKLSLIADISTSHTHGALNRDWKPSAKIARRLVNAIPSDYAVQFDLDWATFMPRFVTLDDENPVWRDHFRKLKQP